MKLRLTNEQKSNLCKKAEEATKVLHNKIREGKLAFFRMDDEQCRRYFQLQNNTFHKPLCSADKVVDDKAYVEAVFLGSGIMSHPIRRAWIPLSEVKVDPTSLTRCIFMSLLNIFKTDEFWERQDEEYIY